MKWTSEIFNGSFSAVSTATIARVGAFFSILNFSRSTRFTYFCTAQISKFQQKIVRNFGQNVLKFISFQQKIDEFCNFSATIWWNFVGISRRILENCKNSIFFNKNARKIRKMLEISGIDAKVHSFSSLVQLHPSQFTIADRFKACQEDLPPSRFGSASCARTSAC